METGLNKTGIAQFQAGGKVHTVPLVDKRDYVMCNQ